MNIVFLAPDYPPVVGGAETFAGEVAERLAQRHEVSVVTRLPSAAAHRINMVGTEPLPRCEVRKGVRVYRVPYLEVQDVRMLSAAPGLFVVALRVIRRVQPEIVHTVAFYPTLAIGGMLRAFSSFALVHTEQGLISDVLRDNVNVLDRYGGVLRPVARWSFLCANWVTCVSSTVCARVRAYFPDTQRISIIPNGVDTAVFKPAADRRALRRRLSLPVDDFVFVSASRLVEKNGIDTLLQATAKLPALVRPIQVVIAGDGEMRPALERMIRDLGVGDQVHLVGTIPRSDLPDWLAAADVFVRPSVSEGFGVSFVEAMACGLPVIATPAVSQLGVFEDGAHGYVVSPGDADELAARMADLVSADAVRARMAASARRWVSEHFDWDVIVGQIEAVYSRVGRDSSPGDGSFVTWSGRRQ